MARIALITGAASGIGKGLATALAEKGVTLVLADIDATGVDLLAEHLGGMTQVRAATLDVRDADAVQALVDDTVSEHGRLDLIFNNAGIGVGGNALELTPEHWDRAIDVNLRGVIHGVQAALPYMVDQGEGYIVNTASLAGLIPSPFLAPYAATKHAVVGLTLSLRAEFEDRGVHFIALCPGFTDTPILDKTMPEDLPAITTAQPIRGMAAAMPGGIYDLDRLVEDILSGVENNDPLVVAPAAARTAWRSFRTSPGLVLRMIAKGAAKQADRFGA
ncbi:MAG: SDR family oxidoreductase [Candidatus Nanopelagicales bacterium]